jgi:hypothetical protein
MKVFAEAIVKPLDRLIVQIFDARRCHRLQDDITDRDERCIASCRLRESMIEPRHREDIVVPSINRTEVAHNVGEMEQLAYLEHALPFWGKVRSCERGRFSYTPLPAAFASMRLANVLRTIAESLEGSAQSLTEFFRRIIAHQNIGRFLEPVSLGNSSGTISIWRDEREVAIRCTTGAAAGADEA